MRGTLDCCARRQTAARKKERFAATHRRNWSNSGRCLSGTRLGKSAVWTFGRKGHRYIFFGREWTTFSRPDDRRRMGRFDKVRGQRQRFPSAHTPVRRATRRRFCADLQHIGSDCKISVRGAICRCQEIEIRIFPERQRGLQAHCHDTRHCARPRKCRPLRTPPAGLSGGSRRRHLLRDNGHRRCLQTAPG